MGFNVFPLWNVCVPIVESTLPSRVSSCSHSGPSWVYRVPIVEFLHSLCGIYIAIMGFILFPFVESILLSSWDLSCSYIIE